jgi:hypothetical protein
MELSLQELGELSNKWHDDLVRGIVRTLEAFGRVGDIDKVELLFEPVIIVLKGADLYIVRE